MRATGISRSIDSLGRIVIPKEIRKNMQIREADLLEFYAGDEGEIILKKYMPALHKSLGVYLPLITTNCAVLGVCQAVRRESVSGFGFCEYDHGS